MRTHQLCTVLLGYLEPDRDITNSNERENMNIELCFYSEICNNLKYFFEICLN